MALIRRVGKTSKLQSSESMGQCCLGETRQHSSVVNEMKTAVAADIRQRFSTAFHSVSPWRPALKGWTADHDDEMMIYGSVLFVSVQFTSVLAELERTARGTDGNSRMPSSVGG